MIGSAFNTMVAYNEALKHLCRIRTLSAFNHLHHGSTKARLYLTEITKVFFKSPSYFTGGAYASRNIIMIGSIRHILGLSLRNARCCRRIPLSVTLKADRLASFHSGHSRSLISFICRPLQALTCSSGISFAERR